MGFVHPLKLVEDVGRELARRGPRSYLELCRKTWVAMKTGEQPPLSVSQVRDLAHALQIAPYEKTLTVQLARYRCERCARSNLTVHVLELPDRYVSGCRGCGARWLVLR